MAWVRAWILLLVNNLLLSSLALLCLYFLVALVSFCFAMPSASFPWIPLALAFFVVGMSVSLLSWLLVPRMVHRVFSLQASSSSGQVDRASQIVEQLALRLGLRPPCVYAFSSSVPNALVLGTSRQSAFLLLSDYLLEKASDAELRAILAHEMGHIYSGDMIGMQLLHSAYIFLALLSTRPLPGGAQRNTSEPSRIFLQTLLFLLSLPPMSEFFRRREIAADRFAAEQYGGAAMISALRNYAVSTSNLSDPLAGVSPFGVNSGVFSGRPSLEERIAALQKAQI